MSNNTLIPLWKQLGYSSQAEYIQALNSKKASTSAVGVSPKLPSLNNYASAMNPSIGKIPSFDNSATRTLTFYNGKWYSSSEVGR